LQDGIQAARAMFPRTWFDVRCQDGIEALRQYQREWHEDTKAFRDRPRHDWTSHYADAFRMLAIAWREERGEEPAPKPVWWHEQTLEQLWAEQPNGRKRI
ncbi:MAG: hypothetical protein KGO50_19380, partial [Myxococcales bacterium]|nr:hypothetical protein [Myxococcales bacterium]